MPETSKFRFRSLLVPFLAWTAVGLFMFSQDMTQRPFTGDPNPWWHYFLSWMNGVYVWFLITPVVLWLGRRFPMERKHWLRRSAIHLVLSLTIAFVQLAVCAAVLRGLRLYPNLMTSYLTTFVFLLITSYHQTALTYWMLIGIQYAAKWYRQYQERKQEAMRLQLRNTEMQSQLMRAQLSALKMQIHPHFLFNTLNAIAVLVRKGQGRDAEEMLARLSDLLRCVLDDVEAHEVPLSRELEYAQLYLSIEQVRFQDRLRVEIAAAPDALDAAVPHMVLQPIIENAIRHGIGCSLSAGRIAIAACAVGDMLEITVEDDGPGLHAPNTSEGAGIGLANTRARLNQLYGDAARLTLENVETGGARATILLPRRELPDDTQAELREAHALHGARG